MLLSDINELKAVLEIDPRNNSENKLLGFYLEQASNWIQDWLGRQLEKKERTEFYNGTGTQRLLLNSRPVFYSSAEPITVYVDQAGYFGSVSGSYTSEDQWVYGTDFCLNVDQADGSSKSGILVGIRNFWPRPSLRTYGLLTPYIGEDTGSVKVTYTGGYTPDTLPSQIRMACNTLVARMRMMFPLGLEQSADNYEGRSVSWDASKKQYLMGLVMPMLGSFRNWSWGRT